MNSNGDAQKEAYSRFLAKNYDQCSASLHALLSSTPRGDPKIQHNVALCEYFKGGCQDAGKFLADLDKLGKSLDRERKSDHPNSILAIEKLAAQRESDYRPLCLEFEGHEYVRYNEAVVHFHQRQYNHAVERLVPMFHNENQISPLLYVRVVLLLLSCTLAQYKKTDPVIVQRAKQLLEKLGEAKEFIQKHDSESTSDQPVLRLGSHALLLRAHYEAVEGSAQEALKLLQNFQKNSADSSTTNWWLMVTYLNNLGMLHLSIGKPHLASLYLAKAIETFEKSRPKSDGSMSSSGMGLYPSMAAVYYNNGLCHMIRGQQELAFKSFVVATPLLKDTPTLWLRMAQCCIRQWETNLAAQQKKSHAACELQITTATAQPAKKVTCLPTSEMLNPKIEAGDDMSLVFAEKCLRNAHYLLLRRYRGRKSSKARDDDDKEDRDENDDEDDNADEGDGLLEESELHSASEEDPVMAAVLQSVYTNMTYVALCLSNPAVALASAHKLLSLPSLFKESRIVVLSYCAEAYCRLGRPEEALALLHKVNLQDLTQEDSPSSLSLPCGGIQQDAHKSSRTDLPAFGKSPVHIGTSREDRDTLGQSHISALFTNLAAVHIMSGKYARAQQCLDQFRNTSEQKPIADLLQIYLHLATGRHTDALEELKRKTVSPPYTVAA